MKKLVLFVLGFSLALGVSAQRNAFHFGDKDAKEIASSIAAFDELINGYKRSVSDLQRENEKMVADFQKPGGEQFAQSYAKKTATNDSLINLYRSKIFELQETKQDFLEMTAGNAKRRTVQFRGSDPRKLEIAAGMYIQETYILNMNKQGVVNVGLNGIVVNKYYRATQVTVFGPAGFRQEFFLEPKCEAIFEIPIPGNYTAVFKYGDQTATVVKPVELGPGKGTFVNGERYDFSAILVRR
ncbi:hypothetical protein JXK06_02085 [Patescibacteria group bacterium]|nr:hypothetical protein [Patescibacteria group bacterium]